LSSFKDNAKNFKGKASLGAIRKVVAEVVDEDEMQPSKDIFLFKGRKYNAWQVLGLPLGSSQKEIAAGYAKKAHLDPTNKSLYLKAYETLKS